MFKTSSFLIIIVFSLIGQIAPRANETLMSQLRADESQYAATCVLKLSAKYFVNKKALSGSIVIININSNSSKNEETLLKTINNGMKFSVMAKDSALVHRNASHFPEKAQNYLMILEKKEELIRNIHQLNKLPTWNPHAKAVVYIKLKKEVELRSLVKYLINQLHQHKLLRTVVLVDLPDDSVVKAYTWRPYSGTNCGGPCNDVFLLDACKNGKIRKFQMFTDIIPPNLQLCPLNVYTVVSEPYVMKPIGKVKNSSFDDEYDFKLGIEVNLIKMIGEILNMSVIVRMSQKQEDWGELLANGTATGLYGKVRYDEADLIIGNLQVDRIIRKWLDPSNIHMQDSITWCVPKAGTASTWSNLLTIFALSTWITTLASILIVSCLLHWFECMENPEQTKWPTRSILMTTGMILGWGALFKPKHTSFRILIISWLLFSINLNTSYQSFLRSFLIHPKYAKQISTDFDIMKERMSVGGRAFVKEHFKGSDTISSYLYDNYLVCSPLEECVKQVCFDRNFAVAASMRQAKYQSQRLGKGKSLMYCFDEANSILKYGVVLLARKYYPLLVKINSIMRSVIESGLIWKWLSEVNLHDASSDKTNDILPLGMEHMLGAFLLLLISYVFSFVVLLSEIVIFVINRQIRRKQNVITVKFSM